MIAGGLISRRWIGRRWHGGGAYRLHGGAEALKTRKTRGPDAKLERRNQERTRCWSAVILASSVSGFALWTRQMVGDLIQRFRCGCRPPRGVRSRAIVRAETAVPGPTSRIRRRLTEWKRHTYPEIRRRAAAGAVTSSQTRRRRRTDFHAGTTWAPVGRTPVAAGHRGPPIDLHGLGRRVKGKLRFMLADQPLKAAGLHRVLPPSAGRHRQAGGQGLPDRGTARASTPPRRSRCSSPTRPPEKLKQPRRRTRPNSTPTSGS